MSKSRAGSFSPSTPHRRLSLFHAASATSTSKGRLLHQYTLHRASTDAWRLADLQYARAADREHKRGQGIHRRDRSAGLRHELMFAGRTMANKVSMRIHESSTCEEFRTQMPLQLTSQVIIAYRKQLPFETATPNGNRPHDPVTWP
jgi:hypothetical protein